jgi:hypothetical protein
MVDFRTKKKTKSIKETFSMNQDTINLEKIQERLSNEFNIIKVKKRLKLRTIFYKNGVSKSRGIDAISIVISLIFMIFSGKSINEFTKYCQKNLFKLGSKDIYYRLSNSKGINWRKILIEISLVVMNKFKKYSSWSNRVLVLDDTVIEKRGKKIEYLSWVFDHCKGKKVKGFKGLVLGWSDVSSFIPIDFALTGSSNKVIKQMKKEKLDKRSIDFKRRKEIDKSKVELGIEMLRRAMKRGIEAGAVLFDSWYCSPKMINKVYNEIGYNVITMLKRTPKFMVVIKGKAYSASNLWDKFFDKLSKQVIVRNNEELLIATITGRFGNTAVKLVFCKPSGANKKLTKDVILLSTDLSLSAEEIIDRYTQRWSIEVLFKEAKSKLFFGKYQNVKFNGTICFLTLSLIRFIMLSYIERVRGDIREKGSIFQWLKYEIEELNALSFIEHFINRLLCIIGMKKESFAFFIDKIEKLQGIIAVSIENLLFMKCET